MKFYYTKSTLPSPNTLETDPTAFLTYKNGKAFLEAD